MIRKLSTLFLSLFASLTVSAQSAGTVASRDAMLFESSRHLFQNSSRVSLVSQDMEWPKGLGGSTLPDLQRYLTVFFFGREAESYDEGWRTFKAACGNEIVRMPEVAGLQHRYYDMTLRCLWLEVGRYVSFFARFEERSDSLVLASKHQYFTYDLVNNRILSQKDVFHQARMWQDADLRYQFCEVLDAMANVELTDSVDWDRLPGQFALRGSDILFDLGVDDTGQTYSLVADNVIDVLLARNFKKWQRQPVTSVTAAMLPKEAVYGEQDSAVLLPDSLPSFPGNVNQVLAANLSYVELNVEKASGGRSLVTFIVDRDGALKDICFLTVHSMDLNRAIAMALRMMPRWKPAVIRGEKVAWRYNLPIQICFQ
ncbi:MAG: energy transducer TonB [Prevotella sp.]|nr:energy transducer TonB [Prevotella sp.]